MKRTTAEANITNLYTEGNPSLSIPATVVGAEEMNSIQEEICNVIEYAGITLTVADDEQLRKAIQYLIKTNGNDQLSQALADASTNDITDLVFDKTDIKSVRVEVDLFRRNDSQSANESGTLFISHNTETDGWEIAFNSYIGDCETTFAISASGQVSYTTSSYAGTGYTGTLRVFDIKLGLQ